MELEGFQLIDMSMCQWIGAKFQKLKELNKNIKPRNLSK